MAGAYAGAVAGAMAGAMSARRGGVASIFRSPGKASSEKKEEPVSGLSRSGSHQPPAEPPSPQRTIPRNPSAGAFSTASGEGVSDLPPCTLWHLRGSHRQHLC